jgi:hypothetical protein
MGGMLITIGNLILDCELIILSTLKYQSDRLRQFVHTSNIEVISLSHENS